MGSDLSKPKSAFNQWCPHLTRVHRTVHISPFSSKSDSFSGDEYNSDFHMDDKEPSATMKISMSRKFLLGRKRAKSSSTFAPGDLPSSQWSFWKDYELEKLRRPSDISQTLALLVQEFIKLSFDDNLHMSPVAEILSAGGKVLDIGCGNAAWSYSICMAYPHCHVTGFEMSNKYIVGPSPRNFKFQRGGSLTHLPFPDGTFDLVYSNLLISNAPKDQSDAIITELIRVTKPGGYFELVENDYRGRNRSPKTLALINRVLTTEALDGNSDFLSKLSTKLSSHPELLFVQTDSLVVRIGPRDSPAFLIMLTMLRAMEGLVAKGLGLGKSEYEAYVEECMNECCELGSAHVTWVGWGQKSLLS